MADKITADEYKGLSDSAKSKVANDSLAALAKDEKVSLETDDNKADMIAKLDKHFASSNAGSADTSGKPGEAPADGAGTPNGVVAAEGWGTAPATPAASGNGAHVAETVPPAPAVGGTPVENDGPGQGRVEAPDANAIPADAPTGAVPQANPNTPDHHDATAAGQGPGGTTLDEETAKRTGAAIADPDAREPTTGDLHVNELARSGVDGQVRGANIGNTEADSGEQAYEVVPDNTPQFGDMLAASLAIDARLAAQKKPLPNPDAKPPVFDGAGTGFDIEPHPNEKVNDAIGSTHDVGGREVVPVSPDAEGLPVYVGTAQPVEQPDAQWRANTAS